MSLKRTVFAAAVTTAMLMSSQAFAIRVSERPPPNGMNGPSIQGLNEAFPAQGQADEFPVHSSKLSSVTFPDSSRASSK